MLLHNTLSQERLWLQVTKIIKKTGTGKVHLPNAVMGDIVSISGISKACIADTIASIEVSERLQAGQIDPPTLAMMFAPNDSPVGRGVGSVLTSQKIIERLESEAAVSVSLRVRCVSFCAYESGCFACVSVMCAMLRSRQSRFAVYTPNGDLSNPSCSHR